MAEEVAYFLEFGKQKGKDCGPNIPLKSTHLVTRLSEESRPISRHYCLGTKLNKGACEAL